MYKQFHTVSIHSELIAANKYTYLYVLRKNRRNHFNELLNSNHSERRLVFGILLFPQICFLIPFLNLLIGFFYTRNKFSLWFYHNICLHVSASVYSLFSVVVISVLGFNVFFIFEFVFSELKRLTVTANGNGNDNGNANRKAKAN